MTEALNPVNAHGVIRPSRDLDIVPDPDPDNLRRLAQLLADIDARHVGLGDFGPDEVPFDPSRPEDLEGGANFRLETRLGDMRIRDGSRSAASTRMQRWRHAVPRGNARLASRPKR